MTSLDHLWSGHFADTSLCEPDDPVFQAWRAGVPDWQGPGRLCSQPPLPTNTPTATASPTPTSTHTATPTPTATRYIHSVVHPDCHPNGHPYSNRHRNPNGDRDTDFN